MTAPDYLAIYLNDHLTGATIGVELARRIAGRDQADADVVGALLQEIEQDRETLKELMQRLGVSRDPVKVIVAQLGEKIGRFKLNGHLLSLSPLSRLEELEMLSLGIEGKASMWRALQAAGLHESYIDGAELDRLIERAASQRQRLEGLRISAAAETFGPESSRAAQRVEES